MFAIAYVAANGGQRLIWERRPAHFEHPRRLWFRIWLRKPAIPIAKVECWARSGSAFNRRAGYWYLLSVIAELRL